MLGEVSCGAEGIRKTSVSPLLREFTLLKIIAAFKTFKLAGRFGAHGVGSTIIGPKIRENIILLLLMLASITKTPKTSHLLLFLLFLNPVS